MTKRPILLFDLGGVLVENMVFERLGSVLDDRCGEDSIQERWLRSVAVRSFELGRISAAAFARQFVTEWHVPLTPEAFLMQFATWVKGPYDGAQATIERLRARHHVGCLSNCNELHWAQLRDFLGSFDSTFSSHLLGEIKPDERAFQKVMNELHVEQNQVCFFDDSPSNVRAAQTLGIEAYLVRGLGDAQRVLRSRGFL